MTVLKKRDIEIQSCRIYSVEFLDRNDMSEEVKPSTHRKLKCVRKLKEEIKKSG